MAGSGRDDRDSHPEQAPPSTPARSSHLADFVIDPSVSIGEALTLIDRAGTGGLVLCSADRRVVGFVTDGDVRRAFLQGVSQDEPCEKVANRSPVTAKAPVSAGEALHLMLLRDINQLPVVDEGGVLQDVLLRKDLATAEALEVAAMMRLDDVIISPQATVSEAIERLDDAGTGALVLCDRAAEGSPDSSPTVTCGARSCADVSAGRTRAGRSPSWIPSPPTAPISTAEALELMVEHDIDQLPAARRRRRSSSDFLLRKDIVVDSRPGALRRDHGRRLRQAPAAAHRERAQADAAGGRPARCWSARSSSCGAPASATCS